MFQIKLHKSPSSPLKKNNYNNLLYSREFILEIEIDIIIGKKILGFFRDFLKQKMNEKSFHIPL